MNYQVDEEDKIGQVEARVNQNRYITFRCSSQSQISHFVKHLKDLGFIAQCCVESQIQFWDLDEEKKYSLDTYVYQLNSNAFIVKYDQEKFPYKFSDQDEKQSQEQAN